MLPLLVALVLAAPPVPNATAARGEGGSSAIAEDSPPAGQVPERAPPPAEDGASNPSSAWPTGVWLLTAGSAEAALGLSVLVGASTAYLYTSSLPFYGVSTHGINLRGLYWGAVATVLASTVLMPAAAWAAVRLSGYDTSYWASLAGAAAGHLLAVGIAAIGGGIVGFTLAELVLPASTTAIAARLWSAPRSSYRAPGEQPPAMDQGAGAAAPGLRYSGRLPDVPRATLFQIDF